MGKPQRNGAPPPEKPGVGSAAGCKDRGRRSVHRTAPHLFAAMIDGIADVLAGRLDPRTGRTIALLANSSVSIAVEAGALDAMFNRLADMEDEQRREARISRIESALAEQNALQQELAELRRAGQDDSRN